MTPATPKKRRSRRVPTSAAGNGSATARGAKKAPAKKLASGAARRAVDRLASASEGGGTSSSANGHSSANGRPSPNGHSSVNGHSSLNAHTQHRDETLPASPAADRALVDRCLAGDDEAWRDLFSQQHHRLLASIRRMFGPFVRDTNQAEEIAGAVWYEMLRRDGERLGQFDPEQGCRLSTYFGTVARDTAARMFRADRRRRRREALVCRTRSDDGKQTQYELSARLAEFLAMLTPREREFCADMLLTAPDDDSTFTPSNGWQLSSRIRRKLRQFSGAGDEQF